MSETPVIDKEVQAMESEKQKALDDLKNQVVSISTLLASKIVKENINVSNEDKLFKETLDEIGASVWQK